VPEGKYIRGKVIVVTGAAGGFGRLVCEKTAALGAKVVCGDIDGTALATSVNALTARGAQAIGVVTDVTKIEQVRALAAAAVERFGRIDVMVNNAGIMPLAFYADHAQALPAWQRCIDINIKGVLHGIVAVYDQMIRQGYGHVVNLSSIYSNFPVAGAAVYGASKAAVNFLSEALRVESQGRIKVTNVRPTGVPGTNLAGGIVNPQAIVGILGQNAATYLQQMGAAQAGQLPPEQQSVENIEYYALAPEHLAEQIVYAIDQPLGVSIADITVRASGDGYIL
jgi:NADP-dependent 3-hydroxy acid dehydrogenase YdfG